MVFVNVPIPMTTLPGKTWPKVWLDTTLFILNKQVISKNRNVKTNLLGINGRVNFLYSLIL